MNKYILEFRDGSKSIQIADSPKEALIKAFDKKINISKVKNADSANVRVSKSNGPINYYNYTIVNEKITLYHGSISGIKGDIKPISSEICDFGKGFYMATNKEYAMCNALSLDKNGSGHLYKLDVILNNTKNYIFNNIEIWALYTAYNRGLIHNIKKYKKLIEIAKTINKHDVVIGPIADDRSAYAFQRFTEGSMTDKCLIHCIKHFNLGEQYVFKRKCNNIKIISHKILDGDNYNKIAHNKRVRVGTSVKIVEQYEKQFRRDGKYIDELLEAYK